MTKGGAGEGAPSWSHVMRRSLLAILLVVLVVPAVSGPASARHAIFSSSLSLHAEGATRSCRCGRKISFRAFMPYAPDGHTLDTYAPAFAMRQTNLRRSNLRQSDWRQNTSQSNLGRKATGAKTASISIRAALTCAGGGAGQRQRRAGVADDRARHQARERRQSARGQPRQLRPDADQDSALRAPWATSARRRSCSTCRRPT